VVTHAGDGSQRLFVAERAGRVRVVRPGAATADPFLDLTDRVTRDASEQGLLGLAFPPGEGPKEHFYVYYTRNGGSLAVLARFPVPESGLPDPASEEVLLSVPWLADHHYGGQLAFGPRDGLLYVALGDAGTGILPTPNARTPGFLNGKLLRLDVESDTRPYAIPDDNPMGDEVWAMGLRNPWRFSFDRATGDMYVADVGQGTQGEINFQAGGSRGGEDYGWPSIEGTACYLPPAGCDPAGTRLPIVEHGRDEGCALIGGHVYRGERFPSMEGVYVYGDFCSGELRGLRRSSNGWERATLGQTGMWISTFGEDEAGELYVADYIRGELHALVDGAGCASSVQGSDAPPPEPAPAFRTYVPLGPRGCGA
jgi:glucose/arabinose dehydrogenase